MIYKIEKVNFKNHNRPQQHKNVVNTKVWVLWCKGYFEMDAVAR